MREPDQYVINVAGGLGHVVVSLLDGPGNDLLTLWISVRAVTEALVQRRRVVVACGAGISRSVLIGSAALAITNDMTLADAIDLCRHPEQMPSSALTADVAQAVGL